VHADTCQHPQTRFRWPLSGISGFACHISEPLFQPLPWLRNTILISLVCSFPSISPIVIFAFFISTLRTPIYPTQHKKSCLEQAAQIRHQYVTLCLTLHTRPAVMNHSSSEALSGSVDPWERLKPILETFYMSEKRKLVDVMEQMKEGHGFDRLYVGHALDSHPIATPCLLTHEYSEHQYRYQFRKWKWSRKVGQDNMPQIIKHVKRRFEDGKSSTVKLDGREVTSKKIRRALQDEKRTVTESLVLKFSRNHTTTSDGPVLPFSNSL
jgi:hypothetical protein